MDFAKLKGLELLWNLKKTVGVIELVNIINDVINIYPEELVRLYNPDYPNLLLKTLTKGN